MWRGCDLGGLCVQIGELQLLNKVCSKYSGHIFALCNANGSAPRGQFVLLALSWSLSHRLPVKAALSPALHRFSFTT